MTGDCDWYRKQQKVIMTEVCLCLPSEINQKYACLPQIVLLLSFHFLIFSLKLFPVNKEKHLDQNKFITGTLPTYWSQNEWLQCQLWQYRLIRVEAHNSASRLHYCLHKNVKILLFVCEIVKTINTSWWRDIQIRVTFQQMELSWESTRNSRNTAQSSNNPPV